MSKLEERKKLGNEQSGHRVCLYTSWNLFYIRPSVGIEYPKQIYIQMYMYV
jgi:hypothetical protein